MAMGAYSFKSGKSSSGFEISGILQGSVLPLVMG